MSHVPPAGALRSRTPFPAAERWLAPAATALRWGWIAALVIPALAIIASAWKPFGVVGILAVIGWVGAGLAATQAHYRAGRARLLVLAVLIASLALFVSIIDHPTMTFLVYWTDLLLWAALAIALAVFARCCPRTQPLVVAGLVLCAVALVFGLWNSARISSLRADFELSRGEQEQQAAATAKVAAAAKAQNEREQATGGVKFAEESAADALDVGGLKGEARKALDGTLKDADEARAFLERHRGKQERVIEAFPAGDAAQPGAPGTPSPPNADLTDLARAVDGALPTTGGGAGRGAARLSEAEIANANQADRLNLWMLRFTIYLVAALVLFSYLIETNRTLPVVPTLPIAQPAIDSLFPKTMAAWLIDDGAQARALVPTLLRKGEAVIWCGADDPLAGDEACNRLGGRRHGLMPIDKLVIGDGQHPWDSDVVVESAWFNRYAVVITDPARALDLLMSARGHLHERARQHARARATVHWIWAFPPPPAEELARLLPLMARTNQKLIIVASTAPDPASAALIGDVIDIRLERP